MFYGGMVLLLMLFSSLASLRHKFRHLIKFFDINKKSTYAQFCQLAGFRKIILMVLALGSASFASTVFAAPVVSSVAVPANGQYIASQNLDFIVNFDTNVVVSGTPSIALTIGSTSRQAVYIAGSGSSSLLFRYTVQAGDADFNGITIYGLTLNGGTIQDSSGQAANLALNSVGSTAGVLVGYSPPVAGPVSATVAANSSANPITLNITGSTASSVAIASAAVHGAATVSGTSITYTPTAGYAGPDSFTYTATNVGGTSAPATVTITVLPASISISPTSLPNSTVGTAFSQTITSSGGTAPYSYAVTAGALPAGLSLSSSGMLNGTPTAGGTYNFAITATDASFGTGPYVGSRAYTFTVNAALPGAPTIGTATAGNAQATVTFTAPASNGGSAITGYTVISSPGGITATGSSSPITVTGLTNGVAYTFTVTATNAAGTGAASATSNAVTALQAPNANNSSTTVAANSSANPITLNITDGTASSVAIASAASHGTAIASGTSISYTPTAGYAGIDSFTYTATNATGTSSAATVSITVSAPILSLSTSGLTDTTVESPYLATVTATGGTAPYGYRVISGALATGLQLNSATGEISGTPSAIEQTNFSIEATDAHGFKTTVSYSLQVLQRQPIASNVNISVKANTSVDVDLTQGAIGGPFTGATVVSMAPSNAGKLTIANNGAAYIMTFTPANTFSGNAVIRYTLSNTAGTSAPATVSINVAPRYDVSKDPEVMGLVSAQANAAKRFASTQMANFTNRLESLHGDGWNGSKFGLNVAVNKAPSNNTEVQDQFSISPSVLKQQGNTDHQKDQTVSTETEKTAYFDTSTVDYQRLAIWVNGTINYGRATQDHDDSEYRFTTNGISAGVDYRLNDFITLGTGIGFGHDNSRIGKNGSKSTADSISAIIYSSLRPMQDVFLDGLFGYGTIDFDSKRYITNEEGYAIGSRDGQHYFAAISTGMEFSGSSWMWSPYSRLEISRAALKPFTETASDLNALTYFKQNISVLNGIVGFRGQGAYPVLWGKLLPKVRVEYNHSLQDDDKANLAYADLAYLGPAYQINNSHYENSNWTIGLGSGLILKNAIEFNMEYGTNLDRDFNKNQSIQLGVNFPF